MTPGPWKLELEPDCRYKAVRIGNHGIVTHADDARLIAAAPDLLEFARAVLARHSAGCSHGVDGDEHCLACRARVVIAKAAIDNSGAESLF